MADIIESIQKAVDFLNPSKLGEAAGKALISDTSVELLDKYKNALEKHETTTIGCTLKSLPDSGEECSEQQWSNAVVKDGVGMAFNSAMKNLAPGASQVLGVTGSAIGVRSDHVKMIRMLSDNGVAGYNSDVITVDGVQHNAYIDASGVSEDYPTEPTIYLDADFIDTASGTTPDPMKIKEISEALSARAVAEVHEYAKSNGGLNSYRNMISDLPISDMVKEVVTDQIHTAEKTLEEINMTTQDTSDPMASFLTP